MRSSIPVAFMNLNTDGCYLVSTGIIHSLRSWVICTTIFLRSLPKYSINAIAFKMVTRQPSAWSPKSLLSVVPLESVRPRCYALFPFFFLRYFSFISFNIYFNFHSCVVLCMHVFVGAHVCTWACMPAGEKKPIWLYVSGATGSCEEPDVVARNKLRSCVRTANGLKIDSFLPSLNHLILLH